MQPVYTSSVMQTMSTSTFCGKLTGYFTAENVCRSFRYFNAASDNKKLVSVIKKQKADIICINDANTAIDFERAKTQINTAFSALFPEPSSFEKGQ